MVKSMVRKLLGEDKWAEYQSLRQNLKSRRWQLNKSKNGGHVVRWRNKIKEDLIAYKGGKCEICGYSKKCPRAFNFHHKDPSTKEFGISQGGVPRSRERCFAEADKCLLLCVLCHAELHGAEDAAKEEKRFPELEGIIADIQARIGVLLDSVIEPKVENQSSTSIKKESGCKSPRYRRNKRPSAEVLRQELLGGASWCSLGRKYEVTDNAVKKWAIAYGIQVEKRRVDRIPERLCKECEKEYKPQYDGQKFCSHECQNMARRVVVRPSKEELQKMLETESYAAIARRYDVRRDTVVKWGVQYGIEPTARMKKHMDASSQTNAS